MSYDVAWQLLPYLQSLCKFGLYEAAEELSLLMTFTDLFLNKNYWSRVETMLQKQLVWVNERIHMRYFGQLKTK